MFEFLLVSTITFFTLFFFAFLFNQQVRIFVLILKIITTTFDILTYPIYFFIDKPWKIKRHSKTICADRKYEENGDYSYWESKSQQSSPFQDHYNRLETYIKDVKHLSEFPSIAGELYHGLDFIGRRKILRKVIENGKNKFELSDYEWINYQQILEAINNLTKVINHKFEFKRGDRIAIMVDTCFEWFVTFFALQNLGCEVVTLHATLGELGICYILNVTKVEYLIVQTDLVRLVNKLKPNIHTVKKLIHIKNPYADQLTEDEKKNLNYELFEFDKLVKESLSLPDLNLDKSEFSTNDVAVCMFTSGSTGDPKGVLLTHENIIHSSKMVLNSVHYQFYMDNNDTFLAYLPMSHILECVCEITFFVSGVKMAFGKAQTLVTGAPLLASGCLGDIQAGKPTIWAGVPLIFERIQSSIQTILNNKSPYLAVIFDFFYQYKKKWSIRGFKCRLIDAVLFNFIKKKFGGRVRMVICGGAPIMLDTQIFIKMYLNCQLALGYSSTECAGNGCISLYDEFDHANTGAVMDGVKLRLEDWIEGGYSVHDKPNPRGEVILGTKACSIGYINDPEETEKAFFEENGIRWLKTGDIGEINNLGHLSIIDRKKDLVKLQMGEYIALGNAESVLKNCPFVDNIVLQGNSYHNHLVALVQPNREKIFKLAESIGKNTDDLAKLYEDSKINEEVLNEIKKFGKLNGLLSKEIPYVIKLCPEAWTPNNDLLTATFKVRRTKIYSFYKDSIQAMYKEIESKFPLK